MKPIEYFRNAFFKYLTRFDNFIFVIYMNRPKERYIYKWETLMGSIGWPVSNFGIIALLSCILYMIPCKITQLRSAT